MGNVLPLPIHMNGGSFPQERYHSKRTLEWLRYPGQMPVRGEAGRRGQRPGAEGRCNHSWSGIQRQSQPEMRKGFCPVGSGVSVRSGDSGTEQ